MLFLFLLFLIIAYLLGSLNSAIIVCNLLKLPDPRQQGSGNPGATNVKRVGGTNAAIIVLVGDVLKGLVPVLLAAWLGIGGIFLGLIALAAVLGHMYPLFFNFAGGKGVATTLGAVFGLSLWLGILVVLVWLVVMLLSRYVSLASMLATVATPVIAAALGHFGYVIPLAIMAALVVYRHGSNIQRLRMGTENKFRNK